LNPDHTLTALETGFPLYHWYFMKKWHHSLKIKSHLFPERVTLEGISRAWSIRTLTEYFVSHYTEFPNVDAYLSGYGIKVAGFKKKITLSALPMREQLLPDRTGPAT